MPAGRAASSISNIAWWKVGSNFSPFASIGFTPNFESVCSRPRSVASTPSRRLESAGSAARASGGTAAMARFRLSATVSMSRAKEETA